MLPLNTMHNLLVGKNVENDKDRQMLTRAIASRFYLLSIQERMGGESFSKIQKTFVELSTGPDKLFWEENPNRFYRILKVGSCIRQSNQLADQVEKLLPGTKYLLEHPLWMILGNPNASIGELYEYMLQLEPSLVSKLFQHDKLTKVRSRKKLKLIDQLSRITIRGDFDSLACLLMITREMELLNRIDPYIEAKWGIQHGLSILTLNNPFLAVLKEIYVIVYHFFIGRNNPFPERMNKAIIEIKPSHFVPPKIQQDFHRERNVNSTILWYAKIRKLIDDNDYAGKMKLLFRSMHFFNQNEIVESIKSIRRGYRFDGNWRQLPFPLNELVRMQVVDQRTLQREGPFLD